jgi:peptide/nickel transport system permease protein
MMSRERRSQEVRPHDAPPRGSPETRPAPPLDWRRYLFAENFSSRWQARLRSVYTIASAMRHNRLTMTGLTIVTLLVLMALLAPLLAARPPSLQDLAGRLRPPGAGGWFGADELGRDVYSRVVYGARISLGMVTLVVVIVGPIGLLIGCTAGYVGGWLDAVLMRITDIFLAFPRLILAFALVAALGPGAGDAVLAIALTAWPAYARVARAETLALRNADFIAAARLQGAGPLRIIVRQIMPLCSASVIVRLSLDMAGIIMVAAGLGFLGFGAQPPSPEWGAMISSGRHFILDQWWIAFFPGLAICIASLGFNLLGDGLRDVLDPKQR